MRRWLTGLATAALVAAVPAIALAAFAWNLTVSPTTVQQGQSTSFFLRATNQGTAPLGCLEVELPASFVNVSTSDPVASNGEVWLSSPNGNPVTVKSTTGPGLVYGESVTFTITARPTAAGTFTWTNHAHTSHNCSGNDQAGTPMSITVMPTSTPNPTPTPPSTPAPTVAPPTSTPAATPTARPTSTRPPTSTPSSGASLPPGEESPTPRPGEPSSSPDASGSASPSPPAPAPSSGTTGAGGADALRVAPLDDSAGGATDDLGMGLDVLALLDGPFVWFVPGAAVGVPGLLVIAFVALQAIGALAWIPAMRRMEGNDRRPRRRRPA